MWELLRYPLGQINAIYEICPSFALEKISPIGYSLGGTVFEHQFSNQKLESLNAELTAMRFYRTLHLDSL